MRDGPVIEQGVDPKIDHIHLSLSTVDDATHRDRNDMARMGKSQQFKVNKYLPKRNFRFMSTLGFTCTLMATWESVLLTSNLGLVNGGQAGMVYIYIGTFVGFLFSVISMAEIASLSPTSGGQYHWVSEYASPRYQKFLSYITGWLSVLGWQGGFASITFLCGTLVQGFIALNNPTSYTPERWHGTLLTFAIALFATFINTYAASQLPSLEGLILILHIFGFFATMIPLWVMAERVDAKTVFTEFSNISEWPSTGLAVLVGQIAPIFSFLGPDGATHIAEEIKDASKIVPWCMVATALINGTLGFVILITYLFTMGDLDTVLHPPSGFSFISAFNNALGSAKGATALASLILVLEICSAISILATCSRQAFAFARDNALPFSSFFANVNPKSKIPVNAVMFTTTVTLLLSLINIGSTEAFNAIASLTVGSLYLSYILSIGAFIARRLRPEPLPRARFSLGKFGLPINIFAFFYLCFAIVFTFFPGQRHVTLQNMNWSVLVWGVVVVFAIVQYMVHGRKVYEGPVAYVQKAQ
ncbi:GABA permease [Coccidioides immitis RS]|uniref:GABA permease n=1 Tax=Coccidioides immitis (strain RS) TaxID=246410 RepID=J3KJW6_COCIM|nr:GABA permease [Coccidioides immitis RS]EAS36416.3 GABA permease [Coccidioides immitis RS]